MPERPVLLVHGFASSFRRNWQETGWVDLLQDAGRQVIGVDLLGHGQAEKPHDPAAYTDLEERVAASLPASGEVDAVGFSLGARVVLTLASGQPERFARIVVGGVGANLFRDDDPEPVARAIEASDDETPQLGRLFAQFATGSDNDRVALAACIRARRPPLTPEALGRIGAPVLVVLGDRDFAGPPDPLVNALPDARLVTLAGADHFATPKDFRFLDAALEFLDALPR